MAGPSRSSSPASSRTWSRYVSPDHPHHPVVERGQLGHADPVAAFEVGTEPHARPRPPHPLHDTLDDPSHARGRLALGLAPSGDELARAIES